MKRPGTHLQVHELQDEPRDDQERNQESRRARPNERDDRIGLGTQVEKDGDPAEDVRVH